MDSQTYQVEMEQWKENLRAARDQVSVGALSNSRFHIVSQFSMNHFYRQFKHTLLQDFDVEGDDPREVVQNILFGEQYTAVKEDMAIVSLVNLFIHPKHVCQVYFIISKQL